jgi:hypothetical protein
LARDAWFLYGEYGFAKLALRAGFACAHWIPGNITGKELGYVGGIENFLLVVGSPGVRDAIALMGGIAMGMA